jgi:prevent-host-death family protein
MPVVSNLYDAKTNLSQLVDRAAAGEEIIIAKNGVPLARLVPLRAEDSPRRPGGWEGQVYVSEDFDAPLPADVLAGLTATLLLDTHVFLWWRTDDPRLGPEARDAIAMTPVVFVSAASAWEAAIKIALGRLRLPESFGHGVDDSGFDRLSLAFEHAEAAAALPPHHGDPFDRMLVAQAQLEGCTLVTHDRVLSPYGVEVLWV